MKTFFEEYGLSTVMACCIMFLVVMASPVGGAIKGGLDSSTISLKNTNTEVQAKAGKSIKNLSGEELEEENVSDAIYVGYNTSNYTLVFSHSENSPKYSKCNVKYGEINSINKPKNQSQSIKKAKSGKIIDIGIDEPVMYPNNVLWATHGRTAHTVLIENKIRPYSMDSWFDWYGRNLNGFGDDIESNYIDFINLSNIDTSKCSSMRFLFRWCYCHTLDLSSWDTSDTKNMNDMFVGCKATSINYGEKFIKANDCTINNMFGVSDAPDTYCSANKPSWWQ